MQLFGTWPSRIVSAVAILLFAAPLFIGLGRFDMANDESIYSYSVERILETRTWLTPRSIPGDGPFLEKPPLKFWIVAAAMRAGALPRNEFGMRFFDALFGVVAFTYVLAIGWRLAGPVCGVVALLVMFTLDVFVLTHSFRSNNMEAALVLAYAGGIYHFDRWLNGERRQRWHALGFAGYFVLGFMTKFVAVLFLPVTVGLAFLWRRDAVRDLRRRWREWLAPAGVAIALIAPWFIYQSIVDGEYFWGTMLGEHVYKRLTASLDPAHLNPWHYYFARIWREFGRHGTTWLLAGGMCTLVAVAIAGRSWLARLVLVWAIVPVAIMSFGTSKQFHYAYPSIPPMAIGIGLLVSLVLTQVDRQLAAPLAARLRTGGRVARGAVQLLAIAAMALLLPVTAYPESMAKLSRANYPLRAVRDCMRQLSRTGVTGPMGIYLSDESVAAHPYYYYLRRTGPWRTGRDRLSEEARVRLFQPGAQSPMIMTAGERRRLREEWTAPGVSSPGNIDRVGMISTEPGVAFLMPGPFEACLPSVGAAGGRVYIPPPAPAS